MKNLWLQKHYPLRFELAEPDPDSFCPPRFLIVKGSYVKKIHGSIGDLCQCFNLCPVFELTHLICADIENMNVKNKLKEGFCIYNHQRFKLTVIEKMMIYAVVDQIYQGIAVEKALLNVEAKAEKLISHFKKNGRNRSS